MLWLKRNLFIAITGLVALVLLGGGIFFVMSIRARNAELDQGVAETSSELNTIYNKTPFPNTANIDVAKKEVAKLKAEAQTLTKYLTPVPVEHVDPRQFLAMRDRTLSELRDAAQKSGVALPVSSANAPPYAFSFDVQRAKSSFGPGTFPTIPEQMTEVKALCAALYEARVSRILNVRRAKASSDDNALSAPVQDYTAGVGIMSNANAQAVIHPYEVTFTSFSAELGQVLTSLAKSPHGFVVKAVQVEPEMMTVADAQGGAMMAGEPQAPPPVQPTPRFNRQFPQRPTPPGTQPRPFAPPPQPVAVPPGAARPATAGSDKPVILLKERRLRVTMLVYAIRPAK